MLSAMGTYKLFGTAAVTPNISSLKLIVMQGNRVSLCSVFILVVMLLTQPQKRTMDSTAGLINKKIVNISARALPQASKKSLCKVMSGVRRRSHKSLPEGSCSSKETANNSSALSWGGESKYM